MNLRKSIWLIFGSIAIAAAIFALFIGIIMFLMIRAESTAESKLSEQFASVSLPSVLKLEKKNCYNAEFTPTCTYEYNAAVTPDDITMTLQETLEKQHFVTAINRSLLTASSSAQGLHLLIYIAEGENAATSVVVFDVTKRKEL